MNTDKPLTAPEMPEYAADPDERRVQIARDVRSRMLSVDRLQKERDHVKRLRDSIVADYQASLDQLEEQIREGRQQLRLLVELNGGEKIQVPDVGTVWKTSDSSSISIEDPALFAAWLDDGTHEEAAELLLDRTPRVSDKREAASWVDENLAGLGGELPPGADMKTKRGSLNLRLDQTRASETRR